ncbi:Chemoreceptor glutamine deamidase CheD [Fundidesulfovibrio magnetotacticus]|uniref:Probable chemoreceptor glutamine deamidase CheD n=1 Tax=Fundidesulfovibrio magnetotacticus TaxID=2730080 RepID=A0A6V8LT23_9BACT|nr:chemotaxis protein CheD [Fundidesulfovibrio magnetotacticus]GFK93468.1 Chemoreceptor glutamine deamidase CheD [Fundidesulfovibrio magnetotacticus]
MLKDILTENPGVALQYLKVSEGGVYLKPTLVQTVLGSCLGAAFHLPGKGIGAFFHAFLPRRDDYGYQDKGPVYKFVDTAIEHVIGEFMRMGVNPRALRVTLLGGSNGLVDERGGVGLKNVEAAYEALSRHRMTPYQVDTGGGKGRRVFFLTSTGEVEVGLLSGAGRLGGPVLKPKAAALWAAARASTGR